MLGICADPTRPIRLVGAITGASSGCDGSPKQRVHSEVELAKLSSEAQWRQAERAQVLEPELRVMHAAPAGERRAQRPRLAHRDDRIAPIVEEHDQGGMNISQVCQRRHGCQAVLQRLGQTPQTGLRLVHVRSAQQPVHRPAILR